MKIVEVDDNGFGFIPEGPLKEGIYAFASMDELIEAWSNGYMAALDKCEVKRSAADGKLIADKFKEYLISKGICQSTVSECIFPIPTIL